MAITSKQFDRINNLYTPTNIKGLTQGAWLVALYYAS